MSRQGNRRRSRQGKEEKQQAGMQAAMLLEERTAIPGSRVHWFSNWLGNQFICMASSAFSHWNIPCTVQLNCASALMLMATGLFLCLEKWAVACYAECTSIPKRHHLWSWTTGIRNREMHGIEGSLDQLIMAHSSLLAMPGQHLGTMILLWFCPWRRYFKSHSKGLSFKVLLKSSMC